MSPSHRIFSIATVLLLSCQSAFAFDWTGSVTHLEPSSDINHSDLDQWERIIRAQQEESESVYDEPLATDRPDFTEASSVVGPGVLQLETGYTYFHDDEDGTRTRTHSFPETLFRYGITDNIELRLVWNYIWDSSATAGVTEQNDGAEDLVLGAKFALTSQCGWVPESALILDFSTPTGGAAITSQHAEFGSNYLYGWDLENDRSFAGSFGYSTATEFASTTIPPAIPVFVADRYNVFHSSVTYGIPLNDSWNAYFEYFGLYLDGLTGGRPENYFDSGVTHLFNNNVQFDARFGLGLNPSAIDFFAGTGISIRM